MVIGGIALPFFTSAPSNPTWPQIIVAFIGVVLSWALIIGGLVLVGVGVVQLFTWVLALI